MIIELKDIPQQPIKKLDIHIEFSDSGMIVSSSTQSSSTQSNPQEVDTHRGSENSEIPQEMLNADF